MKTKEELNTLRLEVESLNKKLSELTEAELMQVTGGAAITEAEAEAASSMREKTETKYSEWLHEESITPDKTSAWFGLNNNP